MNGQGMFDHLKDEEVVEGLVSLGARRLVSIAPKLVAALDRETRGAVMQAITTAPGVVGGIAGAAIESGLKAAFGSIGKRK